MKNTIIGVASAAAMALTLTAPARSHDMNKSGGNVHRMAMPVMATAAWARATPGMSKNGGAYMTIRNAGEMPDRLIAVSADVAVGPPPATAGPEAH